jgi:protein TonB
VDVAPVYPVIAREAKVEGTVILEAVIDPTGRVDHVRVLRSRPLLDQAAVDAVRGWRYTPTLLNGVPVPVLLTITVRFTLH